MKNSTAVVLCVISVGLIYTFTLPQWSQVGDLQAQAATYKNELANVKEIETKRDELLAKYKNISPDQITQIEKVLPSTVDTVTLALDLDSIASKYGISIKSVQTSTQPSQQAQPANAIITTNNASSSPYQTVYVDFEFISTYDNFRKFLGDVEKSLRIIDVQSVDFMTGANNLYDYKVSVQTYWTQ